MSESELRVPHWAVATTFVLSLIGLALSTYLTITHFEPQALVCTGRGFINCAAVTTSAQSQILGVPVAILGLANYVVMSALNSPWAWRSRHRCVHEARFVLAIVSMCFVLWLIYAELIIINNICLYCTGVHITTFALLIVLTLVSPAQLGWTRSRTS
ncbi:MAG: Vitamin epoxide reductase [Acidimicrobiaceae bacterium]|nr:Vitamin epoxide reductase [Acidimicrobiaceae bacterium]